MIDTKGLLDKLIKVGSDFVKSPNGLGQATKADAAGSGIDPLLKGLLTGVGGGMLGGLLSGKGSNALGKLGGGAALATLAYKAYQNYMGNQGKEVTSLGDTLKNAFNGFSKPEDFESDSNANARSKAMLLAIINAAKADGMFDEEEREAISEEVSKLTEDPQMIAWVKEQLAKPVDIEELVSYATNPQIATEVYVASLAACRDLNPQEEEYLAALRKALGIDEGLESSIKSELFS